MQAKIQQLWRNLSKNKYLLYYLASFFCPAAIFFLYFAFNHGNLLTVDLGQQYIDLLAFFRSNLFLHPWRLIYTFDNGLGNSMLGTDAYYLASPFNLLLFLFPQSKLPWAVFFIITLKIGVIGLSAAYYWRSKSNSLYFSLAAANAYALSGYVVANYFNLMWLDSLICLPLLIKNLDLLLAGQNNKLWLLTFACWISNFYTGAMTLIFGLLYFGAHFWLDRVPKQAIIKYLRASIAGSFLASYLLLPALDDLLAGKAASSSHWSLSWQFNPLRVLDKLALGSYNFTEMQSGMPNIYLTMPFLCLLLLYFCCPQITRRAKAINAAFLIFLLASLSFVPLVLFWHLGQFPIWYPGRFSFVLIFFILDRALAFVNQKQAVSQNGTLLLAITAIALVCFWLSTQKQVSFLNKYNLAISALFLLLAWLFFAFLYQKRSYAGFCFWFLVTLEVAANLLLSLGNLSFQENTDYVSFAQNTRQAAAYIQTRKPGFYRIEKTFSRSDDDPLTADYAGLSSFNSLSNQRSQAFLAAMGYLHNSNSVTNSGGSPLTDAFLGVRYYIEPQNRFITLPAQQKMNFTNPNQRLDEGKRLIASFKQLQITRTQAALPLLFLTSSKGKMKFKKNEPLSNQNQLMRSVLGTERTFIQHLPWPPVKVTGADSSPANQQQYQKSAQAARAHLTFVLPLTKNGSYYLQIPDGLTSNQARLQIDHQAVDLSVRDHQAHLLNIASGAKGNKARITFSWQQKYLWLNGLKFWYVNTPSLSKAVTTFAHRQPVTAYDHLLVKTSSFTCAQPRNLVTTIPADKNWLIWDRRHLCPQRPFADAFLSTHLAPGRHQLLFFYIPFALIAGILLSLTALFFLVKAHFN